MSVPQKRELRTAIPGPRSQELHQRTKQAVSSGVGVGLPVYVEKAGGGIVADSVLEAEALETVNKAAAPLRAALTAAGLRPAAVDAP